MTTYTTPQGISDYLPNDTKILNANIIKPDALPTSWYACVTLALPP